MGGVTTSATDYPYAGSQAAYQGNGEIAGVDGAGAGANNVVGVLPVDSAISGGVTAAPGAAPYVDAVSGNSSRNTPSHFLLNPAFDPTRELARATAGVEDGITVEDIDAQQGQLDGLTELTPAQDALLPPTDADNPGTNENVGDIGQAQPGDNHNAQLPNAPTIGAVSSPAAGQATVHWTAPVDSDGYGITGYVITATSSDGGTSPLTYNVGNVAVSTVSGLTSAKHYTFTVAAQNAAGTGPNSAASASLAVT